VTIDQPADLKASSDLKAGGPLVPAEQCTARAKSTGQRCTQPVSGGGVCRFHGGAAGQVRRKREARQAAAEAQAMYADRYEPRDAGEALAAAAVNGDQVLRSLQQRIEQAGELEAADLDALGAWMDRVSRLSKAVIDARIEERRTQLSERQGALVADVLRGALADLAGMLAAGQITTVDPAQPAVMRVVATRLRALAGAA
jgi:hypothetical protein